MKKRFLILSSLITLLLTCFSLPIFADEDPTDPPSSAAVSQSIRLDSTFYENYYLLPYVESDGNQYIDTQIISKDNLKINCQFSGLEINNSETFNAIYGAYKDYQFYLRYYLTNESYMFAFGNNTSGFNYDINEYTYFDVIQDRNLCYVNNNLVHTFPTAEFTDSQSIYLFAIHRDVAIQLSTFRMYKFSIYDYDSESYVRYMYPAQVKSTGVIGMYDAIGDVFYPSLGSSQFIGPNGNNVNLSMGAYIGSFITSGLGWIGDILAFAITEPLILIFMAIGLAGAMFRWGRRLVHF